MSNSTHPNEAGHGKSHERKLHRDWRLWAIVILMLGCMAIYLLTLDESVVPGSPSAGKPPATPAPAAP